jgi:uncharacterized membrane protein YbhN (UPF0104 family)
VSPKRVVIFAVVALVVYGAISAWVLQRYELPPLDTRAWLLIFASTAAHIGAIWFYGLLFKESVGESGDRITAWLAFKAAMVGAGVARLIPAGGAITPVAMAWVVRQDTDRGAGPALRTVMLNYAGLLIMAGGGLLIARPVQDTRISTVSLVVIAPFVLIAGIALMFGSGKLATLNRYLPRFARERLKHSMVNHAPGWETQAYIWARLALECLCLWLALYAFSIQINGFQVMASFAVSSLAGGLPGTPGGLGVTEVGLALILAAYGIPPSQTAVAIIVFRVISYWVPAALSFLAGGTTFLKSKEAEAAAEAAEIGG